MINSITVTNHLNESITMELRFPEKSGFLIRGIEGLGPPKATINMLEISGIDGSSYNSAKVEPRNIVFHFLFTESPTIEDTRQKSYKYFPLKKRIKIQVETTNRTCEIYGYTESNEPNIFSDQEGSVISVMCPDPYFYDVNLQSTLFSSITPLFEFPFSNESLVSPLIEFCSVSFDTTKNIFYLGDADIGMLIHIHAVGVATDITITDFDNLEDIFIDTDKLAASTGQGIHAGDDIYISTVRGNKYVTLGRDGNLINILNVLGQNPDWLSLNKGDNIFAYDAATGILNLQFEIINRVAYEGV